MTTQLKQKLNENRLKYISPHYICKNKLEETEQDNLFVIEKELNQINIVYNFYKNYDNILFTKLTFEKFLKFLNRESI